MLLAGSMAITSPSGKRQLLFKHSASREDLPALLECLSVLEIDEIKRLMKQQSVRPRPLSTVALVDEFYVPKTLFMHFLIDECCRSARVEFGCLGGIDELHMQQSSPNTQERDSQTPSVQCPAALVHACLVVSNC